MSKIKIGLFLAILAIMSSTMFLYVFGGNDWLIRKWQVPMDPPGFHDSRQFTWASEAHDLGYDPLIENPVNPRGHQLNYPRIWHVLFALGINESHTNILGISVLVLFYLGIAAFWFSRNFNNLTYWILFVLILSPATMLGVERSNIELLLFTVLAAALLANYYAKIWTFILFIFAFVLKLYPVFGFIYLLKEKKSRFWPLFVLGLGLFILYGAISFQDFKQVYTTTPKLVGSSFGINVFWMGLGHGRHFALPISETLAVYLKSLSYLAAIVILATTFIRGICKSNEVFQMGQHLDAFRVGASIYVGCFLLMNTHDYRLIFLIFTVPQLVDWLFIKGKKISPVPLVTLCAMVISLWSFFIMRFLGRRVTFVFEECSNWIILASMLYFLFASLPEWLNNDIRQLMFRKAPVNKSNS